MEKVLNNSPATKAYLDSLRNIYAVFLWAKWAVVEVPWSGEYDLATGLPLVYNYYDCNGTCEEYRLVPINKISSGGFYSWCYTRDNAEAIQEKLNKELRHDKF